MEASVIHEVIVNTLERLEQNLDLLITSSQPHTVSHALTQAVLAVSPQLLDRREYAAILAALRVLCTGYRLDDAQFQLHVGLSRAELSQVLHKLQPASAAPSSRGRRIRLA